MKKNIVTSSILLALSLSFIQTVSSSEVMDLFTYMKKNSMKDTFHVAAVMQRCSGVYMAYGKYLPTDMQKQKKIFGKIATEFIIKATSILLDRGQNDPDKNIEQNKKALVFFTNHYYSKLEQDQLSTGSIFSGKTAKEMALCKELMLKIKRK
tara:strand:+ start:117 stop:572 length:456 start_codon:yes stop_codon:yes gene_type:complete